MRRMLIALLSLALVVALGACEPEKPGDKPKPKPPAGGQQHPGGQGQQPAPVQGDPGAHNTQPGELDLHVEWGSENRRKPACEWSLNAPGQGHPCENIADPHQADGKGDYLGLWEYETHGKAGDVVFLSAEGNAGTKWIKCSIFWKGAYHALPDSGKHCGGTFTLN